MRKSLLFLLSFCVLISTAVMAFGFPPPLSDNNNPDVISYETYTAPKTLYSPSSVEEKSSKATVGDTPAISKADFVFFIDTTGSMGSYITQVKDNLKNFVASLVEKGIDVSFAVVQFEDIFADGLDSTRIKTFESTGDIWSTSADEVEDMLNSLSLGGGGDEAETPTDAMKKFYDIAEFRTGATRFAFLLTDAPAKGRADDTRAISDDEKLMDMEQITHLFRLASIHTSIVSRTEYNDSSDVYYYKEEYHDLYTQTGGRYININDSDYGVVMEEIAEWVDETTDTDGDGLYDSWERDGYDADKDGSFDVDLASMGATVGSPDLFVYYDWMYQAPTTTWVFKIPIVKEFNLEPSAEALEIVKNQFAAHGIKLHLIRGKAVKYQELFALGEGNEEWNKFAAENFPREYWTLFRYCLFVNRFQAYGDSDEESYYTGIAETIPGQFFIVAEGLLENNIKKAGTFMHELGHTLGLGHGGDDHDIYKPNYLSIMNYLYQFSGLNIADASQQVNYSEYALPSFDKTAVDETKGLDPEGVTSKLDLGAIWFIGSEDNTYYHNESIAGVSIDFDGNGSADTAANIDFYIENYVEGTGYVAKARDVIPSSTNDWDRIKFTGGAIGGLGLSTSEDFIALLSKDVAKSTAPHEEITIQKVKELKLSSKPGNVEIAAIHPDMLYAGVTGQKINITLENIFDADTTATLTVKSDMLSSNYSNSSIEVPANSSVDVEVFVSSSLVTAGNHTLEATVTAKNGKSAKQAINVTAVAFDPIVLKLGENTALDGDAFTSYQASIADTSIARIEGNSIFAVKAGQTSIILTENERVIASVPVYVTADGTFTPQPDGTNPTDDTSNTTTTNGTGSSGGGCNAGIAVGFLLIAIFLTTLKKKI